MRRQLRMCISSSFLVLISHFCCCMAVARGTWSSETVTMSGRSKMQDLRQVSAQGGEQGL